MTSYWNRIIHPTPSTRIGQGNRFPSGLIPSRSMSKPAGRVTGGACQAVLPVMARALIHVTPAEEMDGSSAANAAH
jgi:hypothetical protein